ncbi:isopropylmalate/homocitrate/citramalate synthase (plasmid) [Allorhizobium ampelinum S4]|uniref:Isopropylmalate/homocitrate/citramalate synthase n=1 Tax=Allorhizobium ampelinum (strain ATCC BAA-846 / DSM 112012 / S4) TaxID=311402 RepID=B9K380_ALLAM|nr:isopropylmalate/homocitrate/citramalate synthase [Allorhizobium ampelinum]ACM39328.1 isopropylmalate/homocitrate/citramalate synthase [Allorhizobium ampelinum S4]
MSDLILETALSNRVIFHEEVARDGAQGKTLLNGHQRVQIAKRHSSIFGEFAPYHLVFNAGFPSAGKDELEATRQVVDCVDECYVGAAGRATRQDVDLLLQAVHGARHGRIFIAVPASNPMAYSMMHCTAEKAKQAALDMVRYARDKNPALMVDVALADASRSDVGFLAASAAEYAAAGASMVIVCDTVGQFFPSESRWFFDELARRSDPDLRYVAHMHNDLGFGLVNTLEALSAKIYGLTSSWLSLGERAGMPATEQLLFALGYQSSLLPKKLGVVDEIWRSPPDLRQLSPIARYVSQSTRRPLMTTDPIVGTGVNTISTGTPFTNPALFQPFDPLEILGVEPKVLLSSLASHRIIHAVAARLGWALDQSQASAALEWVKAEAFSRNVAIIEDEDFEHFLKGANFAQTSAAAKDHLRISR